MNVRALMLAAVVASATAFGVAGVQPREGIMEAPLFVVLPHLNGSLALRSSQISGVWYRAATPGAPSQLRVLSPALGEAKTLSGEDAEALWTTVHEGALAGRFLFTPHMDGIFAIPRNQIGSAFYSNEGGKARLRLVYEADPSGKTIEGDEATRLWKQITEAN